MPVDLYAERFELLLEGDRRRLVLEEGDNDSSDIKPEMAEDVDEPKNVGVVGDADVAPLLVFLDVARIDNDDDLGLVLSSSSIFILLSGSKPGRTLEAW